ncbi:DUF3850 domain-containing protein [Castellaniella ginsengisoli]|uniref:DUF3850 domain-containing protein n=1 Tax=Castellaniella ginsengisoli TaxID=546114 RepID=A0AB39FCV6_9BURK
MTTKTDITLPEPAFKLRWHDDAARYTVSVPNIGDTDCYTTDQVRAAVEADRAAQVHDNVACIANLSESDKQDQSADLAGMVGQPAPVAQEPVATTGRTHSLKTDPEVFQAVFEGRKTFELRVNDRGFRVGDELLLKETTRTGAEIKDGAPLEYTGRTCRRAVGHILTGYGLAENWCCLSFAAPVAAQARPVAPAAWKEIALNAIRRMRAGHVNCMDIIGTAEKLLEAERGAVARVDRSANPQGNPVDESAEMQGQPSAQDREDAPSIWNPLTPYGVLVQALRIVAGTTLMEMSEGTGYTPSYLSGIEFGRNPVTDGVIGCTWSFLEDKGIKVPLSVFRKAADRAAKGAGHG